MSSTALPRAGSRNVSLIAVVLLSLTASGQAGSDGNPHPPKMTNVPGLVTASPAGSAMLTGHYEIRLAQSGDPFIFSGGIGGACLFAQYPVRGGSCTRHSDCALPASGTGDGTEAVCVAESPGAPTVNNGGTAPPSGAGTCWFKPSNNFCLTRVGEGPHDTPPADSAAVAMATGARKWRVLSCLNGVPGACAGADAKPNELQLRAGPVYTAP